MARPGDVAAIALLAVVVLFAGQHAVGAASVDYDVVVYGSTPAGIAAAVAAGALGMKVALFEPLTMIGGMGAAGNLALNDGGNDAEHTGLALNFTTLNAKHYGVSGQVSGCMLSWLLYAHACLHILHTHPCTHTLRCMKCVLVCRHAKNGSRPQSNVAYKSSYRTHTHTHTRVHQTECP